MRVTVPGGPYSWITVRRAAPQLAMTAPIDLDRVRPGRAYWLPRPDVMGMVTPEDAKPVHVIQRVREIHGAGYMDLAAWIDLHPLDLAAWMDGEQEPSGPAWDMLLLLLAAQPTTVSAPASATTRLLWRGHAAAPEDDQIMAALYDAALEDVGAPREALGAVTVYVVDHIVGLRPLPVPAIDRDNIRAYIAFGIWCAMG